MGQALYRKYRPKSLAEVVGQEHITATLQKALKAGRLSHAYLFTGPRGVGKTSVARIMAHEVNQLPYDEDSAAHIDIIEIDAASNRRIDEIRDLRDKVHIAPALAAYKVYIIDEVHMLTKEAFNALLKTLEEPPQHVIFILATTDTHKLPETIISRTQRFTFRPADRRVVSQQLAAIAKQEGITITEAALELLAEYGEGSFRDSISLLDQVSDRKGRVDVSDVEQMLGLPPKSTIEDLASQLLDPRSQLAAVDQNLQQLLAQGVPATVIARQLSQTLRRQLFEAESDGHQKRILQLLEQLLSVAPAFNPERQLEIVLLSALVDQSIPVAAPPNVTPAAMPAPKKPRPVKDEPDPTATLVSNTEPMKPEVSAPKRSQAPMPAPTKAFDSEQWEAVLVALKKKYNTLYGVARMAQLEVVDEQHLRLSFAFVFHQKRLSESKNRQLLEQTITETTGHVMSVECQVDTQLAKTGAGSSSSKPPISDDTDLSAISAIFGDTERVDN